jgi:hypothetical protein
VTPRTVIAHYALNGQMRSKEHTALTAPLVLHHTRIYKRAMKKIIINGQLRNKHFFIVIYHFSLVKAAMNAARVFKMCNGGVIKTPSMSSFLNCQRRNEYSPQLSKLKYNWKLKKQGSALIL